MVGIPVRFRKGGEVTASYDWFDFASGAGYKRFYAAGLRDSTGVVYFLTNQTIDSGSGSTIANGGVYTSKTGSEFDIDFDITTGVPMTIANATAHVNLILQAVNVTGATVTVTIYHVTSGGTETSLGASTSFNITAANWYRLGFNIALSKKTFAIGEKIRVNFTTTGLAGAENIILYHDPTSSITQADVSNRTLGTDFIIDIPFEVKS